MLQSMFAGTPLAGMCDKQEEQVSQATACEMACMHCGNLVDNPTIITLCSHSTYDLTDGPAPQLWQRYSGDADTQEVQCTRPCR